VHAAKGFLHLVGAKLDFSSRGRVAIVAQGKNLVEGTSRKLGSNGFWNPAQEPARRYDWPRILSVGLRSRGSVGRGLTLCGAQNAARDFQAED